VVCSEPKRLRTILGSCVSVCLFDPEKRVGGMNHFMLPRAPNGAGAGFRYGDQAMQGLLERMQWLGCEPRQLCAHVYGGAKVLAAISGTTHLGQGNVDFALDWLDERGITIVSSGVLGTWARRLDLDVASGACSEQLLGTR
jgi:chemotaxis protein CheD